MRTREESLEIIRNALGGNFSTGSPAGKRVRTRDDSLRILQSAVTEPAPSVILNREAVKDPENRTPGAENDSPMFHNDVGATLAVARPNGSPSGGAGVSPPTETKPMGSGGGGFSGGGGSPSGRSTEQIQQEIADSRKQLAQLGNDAAYILTAEPGAELGRQMDEVRARIKSLNAELEALKRPNTNTERDSLIQRMNDITANEGYATTVEQADALTQEKQETRQRLHQLDEELGNATRFYDSGERAPAVIKGALKQTGSAYTNFMGTLQGVGNRLHELSSAFDKAVAGSEYSGWATDELSAANIAASSDGKGLEALEREEQRLYDKADTIAERAEEDIAQAKEGLGALGKIGVDISVNMIQNGMDAIAKAAGLGMLPFFVRAAGSASMEARHEGASTWRQVLYGLETGTNETVTELLTGGIAGTGFSGLDRVFVPLIGKLAKSATGRIALQAIYDAATEGAGEVLSDLLDPFTKLIYNDQALKEAWESRADVGAQMLYDFMIGAVSGSIGSGTKMVTGIATGQNAKDNAKLAVVDVLSNDYANTAIEADGILSGGQTTAQSLGTAIKAPAGNNVPLQQNIDNENVRKYTDTSGSGKGGMIYGSTALDDDGGVYGPGGYHDAGGGVPGDRAELSGVHQSGEAGHEGRRGLEGTAVGIDLVLLSEESLNTLNERGIVIVEVKEVSGDKAAFSVALDSARSADVKNGWAVTPKSAEELESSGARPFMSENGAAGFAVAPDGDIEAVFANKAAGAPAGTTKSMIPQALANGGTKLDCYGAGLVKLYSQYGFIPVARTKFDPQYANPGWDPSKGTPDIFFMMNNGDNADTVVQKNGSYPAPTPEQLESLPEMDYDSAYAYRDRLLAERSGKGGLQNDALLQKGAPLGGAVERSETEGGTTAAENKAANTDPAALALQQQYQTEIAAALRAGDYQQALTLFKEYGNPNLRALNEVQTLKAFTEYADTAGYGIFTSSSQEFIYPAWEYAGTRKSLDNSAASGILKLPDIPIGRSLGAKAKNYDIELPNKEIIHLTEGTRVTNVHVIAGKGRNRQIDIVTSLVEKFPGTKEAEWQKVKGVGYVDYHGESYKADLHWYEEPSVGRVGWKVKPDADGNWFIDED